MESSDPLDNLVADLDALNCAGGVGYWSMDVEPLLHLAQLKAVVREAGSHQFDAVTRAIVSVVRRATGRLEPHRERRLAQELLGYTHESRGLHSRTSRQERAANVIGCDESTYRRRHKDVTLRCLAKWLLEHDGPVDDGPSPSELDDESSLDQLAEGLRDLPMIDGASLAPLVSVSLDGDLRRMLAGSYHSLRFVRDQQTFLSVDTALELRELAYDNDNDDWVYVLARRDHRTGPGFVQQRGWSRHVRWLREHARNPIAPPRLATAACGSSPVGREEELGVRQIRVVIADDYRTALASVDELVGLHRSHTLFYFPESMLSGYRRLRRLRYGMTVSTSHDYAMVSVPPTGKPPTRALRKPSDFVDHYLAETVPYHVASGDMRAVVTASIDYVNRLKEEFEQLIASKHVHRIPCTCEGGAG